MNKELLINRESEEELDIIRHDCAHVLAEAVQSLYPGTQVTIGPTIENGFYYDFFREKPFTSDDLIVIEKKMREIVNKGENFKREVWTQKKAIDYFSKKGETYKVELINDIPEAEEITIYKQGGWLDLCRGPHGLSTKDIGEGFKLTKVAGAYWRGDSSKTMLTRIYGTAWRNKKELKEYLVRLEEAEKRDHRKLGKEMDLFHLQEEAPGAVFWHPKGWYLFQSLINYMRKRQEDAGYVETNTPDLLDRSLWEKSGHWEKFGENMFTTEAKEERVFAIKPMNCPGAVEIYKQGLKSYRDLPLRMAEFGKVHRYEPSGALHGLMRVRAFTQDDAHIFCTEDQITSESKIVCDLILSIYKDFGFENVRINYSDRPITRVGSDEIWDKAEKALINAMEATGLEYSLNPGDGAFYGPKLEFVLRDAIGRDWQCGTLQVDLNLPGRLNATYIGEDGQKKTPVMLHRALFGSLERFAGILIEHYAGHLPFWLSPLQIVIATITSDSDNYADDIFQQLRNKGLRVEKDVRNEKIGYKIREHSTAKIPVIMVIGKKEAENKTVSVRRLGSEKTETFKIDEILKVLFRESLPPNSKEQS
ncbi:MAG: threonine--tRNA ligase [Pelagibacteraceae bacterium]|jgi:threonyl-tRNA synthetase|nr:threonine--tRNA ligase [Pelagibacteraceae bacterium]MBO6467861.1 threonine--tRNA ligase [Pelagibacteraceae bacterium]MBO6469877.1 threonine--tRNA ligase [Pelagibacteraceae bacterium]MBO6479851.1 threonine--tRNA ligase [Pelagibacteraceae bacterium]HJO14296.1 threonine--tRNA ligase [Alphaproteobacteria bacterium]